MHLYHQFMYKGAMPNNVQMDNVQCTKVSFFSKLGYKNSSFF